MQNNIPMPPQSGAPRQPKFGLKDTKPIVCDCGGKVFREAFFLRELSRILTGETKDTMVTVPIFVCNGCGKPVEQMLPADLKD